MGNKQKIYWIFQIGGWTIFAALNLFFFKLNYSTNVKDILNYLIWLPVGIGITHLFRLMILKFKVLQQNIISQITVVITSGFINAFLFFTLTVGFAKIFGIIIYKIEILPAVSNILSLTVIFIFWSLIYFGFHFFDNYKRTEIQNLKLEAHTKEIELNKLKSQLNPHFMFNCMNSIRALVDEDPKRAKVAITQLSSILRNTLLMHKNKFITLQEELALVKDYLELELIRYEERLAFTFNIDPKTLAILIPPMMLQTLVENGIKHGISKYPEGGTIHIKTELQNNIFMLTVLNTGRLAIRESSSGFGVANTVNRLELLYSGHASFKLQNNGTNKVLSEIKINLDEL